MHLSHLEGEEPSAPAIRHAEEAEGERVALHRGGRGRAIGGRLTASQFFQSECPRDFKQEAMLHGHAGSDPHGPPQSRCEAAWSVGLADALPCG